ncbi:Short-chain dehydrogenase/reductase SDR [uncultured Sphingopyxis sp.]|uniref:Short-chain dehydrogenase/reductase SDR n=1 Tax=uncultured Sphingopyxis sp. TaxID=310581 RepID=A0A1Y5PS74_9SPHN|nr:SDR family NAD(P)-dependent oxidoreductase [uncultured Sphingopyxis sp.]SBV32840.1 Short-chain dehydrogenase/reductase SDR [uncultured Sphingopyxis sp.]
MNLRGKLALVTGGSDGIGREIALQLQGAGADVIVTGRSAEKLRAMAGLGFGTIAGDLSMPAGIDAVIEGVAGKPLALLVNNAGVGSEYALDRPETLDDAAHCIRTNLDAPIALCTRLLPLLRAQPEAVIVNVTSGLAIAPRAGGPVYCATKAGLRSYTQAIRHVLKHSHVRVIEALPPVVETNMTAGRAGRKMNAHDCAAEIVRGIRTGKSEVNAGMVKLLQLVHSMSPALARRIMIRF